MIHTINIPADIPRDIEQTFIDNYRSITRNTNRLFLFSCDQKIEHLHDAFDSDNPSIHPDALFPEHLFKIGSQGDIGAMATQLELVARYGKRYPMINYVVKLNSKTNLIPPAQKDPVSAPLYTVDEVVAFQKESHLSIAGIGVTIYLGSEFEDAMLSFASESIFQAHQHGLLAFIWMYPRGKAIPDETDAHLLAGAAGAANALGADFVKIKAPTPTETESSEELLKEIVAAAGNTLVLCAGGEQVSASEYLEQLYEQLHVGGTAGTATGRNIFQRSLPQAIAMTRAISALVYDDLPFQKAVKLIKE